MESPDGLSDNGPVGESSDDPGGDEPKAAKSLGLKRCDTHFPTRETPEVLTPLAPPSPTKGAFPFPGERRKTLSSFVLRRNPSTVNSRIAGSPARKRGSTTGSPSPDRFVPSRDFRMSSRESFMLSTPPSQLGTAERRDRQQSPLDDPFAPSRHPATRPSGRAIGGRRAGSVHRSMQMGAPAAGPMPMTAIAPQRVVSQGAVWRMGGTNAAVDGMHSVSDGRGGRIASSTNAPMYISDFFSCDNPATEDQGRHQRRLAAAFDIDPTNRIFGSPDSKGSSGPSTPGRVDSSCSPKSRSGPVNVGPFQWKDNAWSRAGPTSPKKQSPKHNKSVPIIPFRVLDAPALRDDYYCSLLAYSHTAKCLAVGLASNVYLWSEARGANTPETLPSTFAGHVTSLSFSSTEGGHAILAVGRADGLSLIHI